MRLLAALFALLATPAFAAPRYAVIDMHLHAENSVSNYGPPPVTICAPYDPWPTRDAGQPIEAYLKDFSGQPACANKVLSAATVDEERDASLAQLTKHNVLAVASGPPARVADWKAHGGDRIISAVGNMAPLPSIAELRRLHKAGQLQVLGEIVAQYDGIAPNDPSLEPYYALAEELDLPVGIHVGPGPPGVAYFGSPRMQMAHSRATLLEGVLLRHPKLRLYVMHAGWPFADDMIALMYAHPQVYCDIAILDYAFPKAEFYAYLKRLVDAGFGKRIMYGSDQMIWPGSIDYSIAAIRQAPFLSPKQKRDILHDNAARFLRIEG